MNITTISSDGQNAGEYYKISLRGHLQKEMEEWFEDLTVTWESDGTTTLHGQFLDQTALHTILLGIRNLNLKLISVREIGKDSGDEKKIVS